MHDDLPGPQQAAPLDATEQEHRQDQHAGGHLDGRRAAPVRCQTLRSWAHHWTRIQAALDMVPLGRQTSVGNMETKSVDASITTKLPGCVVSAHAVPQATAT